MFISRETNLKVRQPLPETHDLQDIEDLLIKFDGDYYNSMIAKNFTQIF